VKPFTGLIDSHFHSQSMVDKAMDVGECLTRFFAGGGELALDMAVHVRDGSAREELSERFPGVYIAAGIHPSEAGKVGGDDWILLRKQLSHPKALILGEIGLDWYRGRDREGAQRELFRRQLSLAQELAKPVSIHNREADKELLEDLAAEAWKGPGIFHCFSSDLTLARKGLDLGFYLSFAGNVTYPSSSALREVARWAPADRLLVETDSPYLSPQGFRGQPNQPLNASITATTIAQLRGESLEEFLQQTRSNFRTLVGWAVTGLEQ